MLALRQRYLPRVQVKFKISATLCMAPLLFHALHIHFSHALIHAKPSTQFGNGAERDEHERYHARYDGPEYRRVNRL